MQYSSFPPEGVTGTSCYRFEYNLHLIKIPSHVSRESIYTRDATFSLAITPSLDREIFSSSVDAGFVLALPFHYGDLESDCVGVSTRGGSGGRARGVAGRRTRGREMLPTLAVGWRASALRAEEAGRVRKVAGVSIVAAGGLRSR